MSTKANDPANPTTDTYIGDHNIPIVHTSNLGLTKRELFAKDIYAGMIAANARHLRHERLQEMAASAVDLADSLIEALNTTT